jgi:hypothetical protein
VAPPLAPQSPYESVNSPTSPVIHEFASPSSVFPRAFHRPMRSAGPRSRTERSCASHAEPHASGGDLSHVHLARAPRELRNRLLSRRNEIARAHTPRTGVEYGTSRRFSYVPPVTGPPAHSFPPGAKGTRPGGTSPYGRCNAIRVPDSVWRTVDVPHSESIRAVRHPATGAGGSYQPTGKVNGAVGAGQRWSGRVATRGSRIDATMPAANAAMVARSWKR